MGDRGVFEVDDGALAAVMPHQTRGVGSSAEPPARFVTECVLDVLLEHLRIRVMWVVSADQKTGTHMGCVAGDPRVLASRSKRRPLTSPKL